jgi:ribosomal protein S18 acetylase RimI-like enzyme
MNISLRPVAASDEPFLLQLYSSTRELEMSQVPWSPEQKQAFVAMQFTAQAQAYASSHPKATHETIWADGKPVGRLYLDRAPDGFHILDITIAPEFRNAGIGSQVLREIIEEADRHRKPIGIYTETFNPSQHLFARLGFLAESSDGVLVLLRRPSSPRDPVNG